MFSSLSWICLFCFMAIMPLLIYKGMSKGNGILNDHLELGIACVMGALIVVIYFYSARASKIEDFQILSGEIISKEREKDTRTESYKCGDSTCYRTIYILRWNAITNVGKVKIDQVESRSSAVYFTPDPARFKQIIIGEPASIRGTFKNYVAASSSSIFKIDSVAENHKKNVIGYPEQIYDFYRTNRVYSLGSLPSGIVPAEWNKYLDNYMKKWGPKNKSNIIFVFTSIEDDQIVNSLKNRWLNGKQNDLVIVMGLDKEENLKLSWVEIFSWTDSNVMKLKLRDDLLDLGTIKEMPAVFDVIDKNMPDYKVKDMETDFKYLEGEIFPDNIHLLWGLLSAIIGVFFGIAFKRKHLKH